MHNIYSTWFLDIGISSCCTMSHWFLSPGNFKIYWEYVITSCCPFIYSIPLSLSYDVNNNSSQRDLATVARCWQRVILRSKRLSDGVVAMSSDYYHIEWKWMTIVLLVSRDVLTTCVPLKVIIGLIWGPKFLYSILICTRLPTADSDISSI